MTAISKRPSAEIPARALSRRRQGVFGNSERLWRQMLNSVSGIIKTIEELPVRDSAKPFLHWPLGEFLQLAKTASHLGYFAPIWISKHKALHLQAPDGIQAVIPHFEGCGKGGCQICKLEDSQEPTPMTRETIGETLAVLRQWERLARAHLKTDYLTPAEQGMTPKRPPPCVVKAYSSFLQMESKFDKTLTDRQAYQLLKEHGCSEDSDYEPPCFETWRTYLTTARRVTGNSRHSPRAGRVGRDVVAAAKL